MPEWFPEILFDRDQILVVNKREGVASVPEQNSKGGSLLELLQREVGGHVYVVHRLDKAVSGVIVFARDARTHRMLNDQFQNRQILKTYVALVHGTISDREGIIDKPLRQFGSGRVAVDGRRGKGSRTTYQVREHLDDFTLLQVQPFTGRRHQIRAHLYSIKHPIVGDLLYGEKQQQLAYPRMMLHSESITFKTLAGKQHTVRADVPDNFTELLNQARKGNFRVFIHKI